MSESNHSSIQREMSRTRIGGHLRPRFCVSRIGVSNRFLLALTLFLISLPTLASAQGWGQEADYYPSRSARLRNADSPTTRWSLRAGIGFVEDPDSLLLNFELPYTFDRWVSAGPMLQVGTSDHNTLIAPTLGVTITIPDLPGQDYDQIRPYVLVGLGFAYIRDNNRPNDQESVGFLIDFGVGLEYQVSQRFSIGTQMMFNFLPDETLGQDFFYTWQVGGIRIAF